MKTISSKAGLSQVYTNHCVRASNVTKLYQAGVDAQQICSITKHKNERTLSHYISSSSEEQKRKASRILSSALECSTSTNPDPVVPKVVPASHDDLKLNKTSSLMQSVMPNAFFKYCTINFNGFSHQSC